MSKPLPSFPARVRARARFVRARARVHLRAWGFAFGFGGRVRSGLLERLVGALGAELSDLMARVAAVPISPHSWRYLMLTVWSDTGGRARPPDVFGSAPGVFGVVL